MKSPLSMSPSPLQDFFLGALVMSPDSQLRGFPGLCRGLPPWHSTSSVSWGNGRTPLVCFPLWRVTFLHCLMYSVSGTFVSYIFFFSFSVFVLQIGEINQVSLILFWVHVEVPYLFTFFSIHVDTPCVSCTERFAMLVLFAICQDGSEIGIHTLLPGGDKSAFE